MARRPTGVIPTKFTLGAREWTVKYMEPEELDKLGEQKGILGLCQSHCATILINKNQTKQDQEHTFYHELCHAIAMTMGWTKWNTDEDKIDAVAGMFYQFIMTRN